MAKINITLVNETKAFVEDLFSKNLPESIFYHSIDHSKDVVAAIEEIGKNENLTDEEFCIARISGWLHDVGYIHSTEDHEAESARIAFVFLQDKGIRKNHIYLIQQCILATRIPQNPKSIAAAVLCDADMYHITRPDYPDLAKLLFEEFKISKRFTMSMDEFDKLSYSFFSEHNFHTNYGKTVLQKKKEKSMNLLKQKIMLTDKKA